MTIHIVESGDSLYDIGRRYGVSAQTLMYDNQIEDPARLVIGQALFIPVTQVAYQVRPGDSLYGIARSYNTSVEAILAANPEVTDPARIYIGQTIMIPLGDMRLGTVEVNGFTVRNDAPLEEWLPNLTYLSPFSWEVDAAGGLTPTVDVDRLSAEAASAGVRPLMTVTNLEPGAGFSGEIAHAVLTDAAAQDALMANILATLEGNGYAGVIFDFEYVFPYDRESYNQFLRRAAGELRPRGYSIMTAVAPKISDTQVGTLYEAHDYAAHGEIADRVIIMTYEWGYTYGPAMAVAPVDQVRRVLDYAVTEIPAEKILMGMPNYGYDWTLPFVEGSAARTVTNTQAVSLAAREGAVIEFDERAQAPFFNYYSQDGRRHEVWFDDARSIQARLRLIDEYGLGGLSYWTVDNVFRAQYLVLRSMYDVRRI